MMNKGELFFDQCPCPGEQKTAILTDFTALEQRVLGHQLKVFLALEDVYGGIPVGQGVMFAATTSPAKRQPAMNTKFGVPYGKRNPEIQEFPCT